MLKQDSQQHKPLDRISGIAMVRSCTAIVMATLLTSVPSSIGANDSAAPVRLSAMPAQAGNAKEAPADSASGSSDAPTRPTCAELGALAATLDMERIAESSITVGCGIPGNLARGKPASNLREPQSDVATLVAWHAQAHTLIRYSSRIMLPEPSRTNGSDGHPPTQITSAEQNLDANTVGTHGKRVFNQLSMGPDPGGKTGDTVTTDTSKTGQPGRNETGASNQSGATSTAGPGKPDPKTSATSASGKPK